MNRDPDNAKRESAQVFPPGNQKQNESGPEVRDTPGKPGDAGKGPKPEKPARQPRSFWQRLLRWSLGLFIVFGLGALLVLFLLYLPSRQAVTAARSDLNAAQQQVAELESQVERLQALEKKNQELQAEIVQLRLYNTLVGARADVLGAQLALANEDSGKAQMALSKTPEKLQALEELVAPAQQKAVKDMQSRLELAQGELEGRTYAAQSDLDVLATSLLELENALFSSP